MTDQLGLFDHQQTNKDKPQSLVQPLEPIVFVRNKDTGALNSVPENAQFRFTNNYDMSGNYLGHVLRIIGESNTEAKNLSLDNIAEEVSFPKRQLKSNINFLRKCQIVGRDYHFTSFGKLIFLHDPFFLDKGNLWVLHYIVSSNANLVIWSRLFNQLLISGVEISSRDHLSSFTDIETGMTEESFIKNGSSEMASVYKTYSDGVFKSLGIMRKVDYGTYLFMQQDYHIPELPLLACILVYRDRYFPGVASLETNHLISSDYSPGNILRQKEVRIRSTLDQLHKQGLLTVETRLGLDQVRFKNDFSWLDAVSMYFGDKV